MNRLEEELRRAMERRAEEAVWSAPIEVPAATRRRIHIRQIGWTALATALVASVAALSVAGLSSLGGRDATGLRPGDGSQPGPTSTQLKERSEHSINVGTERWSVAYFYDNEELCIRVEQPDGSGGKSCGYEDRPITTDLYVPPGGQVWIGTAPGGTASIRLIVPGGDPIAGQVLELSELNVGFVGYVIQCPLGVSGAVEARDRAGQVLAAAPALANFAPPPDLGPGDLLPIGDRLGDLVGYLPYEYLYRPPPQEEGPSNNWFPPGAPAPMYQIREVASSPLQEVAPDLREWWERRPAPGDQDAAFQDWWDSYPRP